MNQEKLQKLLRIKSRTALIFKLISAFVKFIFAVSGILSSIFIISILLPDLLSGRAALLNLKFIFGFLLVCFAAAYFLFRWGWEDFKKYRVDWSLFSTTQLLPVEPLNKTNPTRMAGNKSFIVSLLDKGSLSTKLGGNSLALAFFSFVCLLWFELVNKIRQKTKKEREMSIK
ncbi:MAG: hypothetical protein HZB80_04070 [Deltaproteobacteria bacterium]|nr:hypothetical protein [Deltaproteobacteria bacterium]